jgi:hypothetical protein
LGRPASFLALLDSQIIPPHQSNQLSELVWLDLTVVILQI